MSMRRTIFDPEHEQFRDCARRFFQKRRKNRTERRTLA